MLGRAEGLCTVRLCAALARTAPGTCGIETLDTLIGLPVWRLEALGVPPAASRCLHAPDGALIAADRRWALRERIALVDALGASYPPLLREVARAPALLYVRGTAAVLQQAQLAIVGARRPSAPARDTALCFAHELAQAGLAITSGMALGIDAAGHEGALAGGGRTVAVFGSGLDRIYPPGHRGLAGRIAAHGALVSEFPPGSAPRREHFPRRNRLISGLSLGTLVIEAARDSGSLITAQHALEQGREVFAVPGSIHNPLTRGCHALIRDGATLVESVQDVLDGIWNLFHKQQPGVPATGSAPAAPAPGRLDKEQKILLDALGFDPASVDTLVERTGLPSPSVAASLVNLQLQGAVGVQPGGRYVRLSRTGAAGAALRGLPHR